MIRSSVNLATHLAAVFVKDRFVAKINLHLSVSVTNDRWAAIRHEQDAS